MRNTKAPIPKIGAVLGLVLSCSALFAIHGQAAGRSLLELSVTVPELDAEPYHRPYIAIWIEDGERKVVRNLALWYEEDTWLKDLRQWWRVHGRYHGHDAGQKGVDGWSGATRRPGAHAVEWDGLDDAGQPVAPGSYVLCLEASREEGGRSFLRQPLELGAEGAITTAPLELPAEPELGPITLRIP